MPSTTRRRALGALSAGASAALAGCTSWLGCDQQTRLRLDPVDDADVVAANDRTPADLHPLGTDLVREAGPSGTATYHGARWTPPDAAVEPFEIAPEVGPQHRYVRLDGSYYHVGYERARTGTTTVREFVGRTNPTVNAEAQSGDAVAFGDLPRHDRRTLLDLLGGHAGQDQSGFDSFAQVWTAGYLQPSLVDASALLPEPTHEYVAYRDWFLQLEPNESSEKRRVDYDVGLAHLADDEAGFAAAVRERDGVVLRPSELSADQRAIVEEAAGGTYAECDEWSPAFDDLVATLAGVRYVRYDGRWYATNTGDWYYAD